MILRDTCYFCTSPFEFIPIFALALSRNESADLYIDPQFGDAELFAERIRRTGLFYNVIVVKRQLIFNKYMTSQNALTRHFQIAKSYLKVDEIAKLILLPDTVYKNMFVSDNAYMPRMVNLYLVKKQIKTEIFYFEDGTGSYFGSFAYLPGKTDRLVRRVLFGKEAIHFIHKKFLFSPEFYDLMNPYHAEEIEKIPQVLGNSKLIKTLNEVFEFDKSLLIKERIVILDVLKEVIFSKEEANKLTGIYHLIMKRIGQSNVIIKKHPRDLKAETELGNIFPATAIPFECVCLNTNMNQKVLISFGSTSVGTPKLLLDQEPTIILLNRLVKPKKKIFMLNEYWTALKSLYSNKAQFIIPNNVNELCMTLDELQINARC